MPCAAAGAADVSMPTLRLLAASAGPLRSPCRPPRRREPCTGLPRCMQGGSDVPETVNAFTERGT